MRDAIARKNADAGGLTLEARVFPHLFPNIRKSSAPMFYVIDFIGVPDGIRTRVTAVKGRVKPFGVQS